LISKSQIKLITSLQQKKYRNKTGYFIAEGVKVIHEFLTQNYEPVFLFSTQEGIFDEQKATLISQNDLQRISLLKTPNICLGVFKIPAPNMLEEKGLLVGLDAVRDPGNLGTIIRLCDWFGITDLVCSLDTVDCYNPKVVQAAMGSLTRVQVHYLQLEQFLTKTSLPIFGACMDGKNIYKTNLPQEGIILMGNEANGISPTIMGLLTEAITIPRFGSIQKTESLNVATATAIMLSEFRSKSLKN
jgi:TrmH family RNA methyltransferase